MINLLTQAAKKKLEDRASLNPEAVSALEELPWTMSPYKNEFLDEEGDNNLIELFVDAVNKYPLSDAQQIWHVLKKVASDTDTLKTFISNVREKTLTLGKFNNYLNQRTDSSYKYIDANDDEKDRYRITDYQKQEMPPIKPKADSPADKSTEEIPPQKNTKEGNLKNNILNDLNVFSADSDDVSGNVDNKNNEIINQGNNTIGNGTEYQLVQSDIQNDDVNADILGGELTDPKGANGNGQNIQMANTQPVNAATNMPSVNTINQTSETQQEVSRPTVDVASNERPVDRSEEIGADLGTPNIQKPNVEEPVPPNPRDEYSDVYTEIDNIAISPEQAEEAKSYADAVFSSPDEFARAYAVLTKGPSRERTKCLVGMLATANRHLGYKNTNSKYDANKMQFDKGTATQAKHNGFVRNSLIMPSGFGTKKNAAIWNTPVITDFGFPFINFSSDAMLGILKSKEGDEVKNDNLKAMFKEASKRYGGIWKAIYAAPLELIKQIATDTGVKCTAKYLKVNGQDLINSDVGENVSVIPIKYYSVDAAYDGAVTIPHDFLTAFYDVIDYSTTSKRMYMKYANGMTEQDFVDEINENSGIPPFYLLVPKTAKFSKCQIRSGSLLGSLLNVLLGRKPCTMVKTILQGKRGALAMESHVADLLYAEI